MKSKIEYQFGYEVAPYEAGRLFKRVKICYVKNDKEQNAVFMDYGTDGNHDYKLIEDNHYARNRLTEKEQKEMGEAIKNNEIRLYAEAYR